MLKRCLNFSFQTASEIERVASGNMYKEQAWVEKLLKRMRNEADVQSQVGLTHFLRCIKF